MIIKVMAVMMLVVVAQIIPSCGGGGGGDERGDESRPDVLGWVDEKRTRVRETEPYMVVINQREHGVPYEFWRIVNQGDLVKYEGGVWTIVRRAR